MQTERIDKPWGFEEILEANEIYTVKRLFMSKNNRCSLQYHQSKKETIVGISGELTIIIDDDEMILSPGQVVTISPLTVHRMWAKFTDCIYLECSTSQLNDVIRVDDDFGRKNQNEQ
jgi:mannose-6-phosphate isomerase-like protein (cupin superfamily)